ncbi:PREDICTED: calumenin-A-like [Priapulus caudatus]|uniref:Calumenin-A-like n=1 Tax=Priapulus caudatus TaxID=37621 RepID=A0ABM1EKD5_PRICU|nr:PREDICTED: calumenin-A-like [Priapulus caudatus]
MKITSGVLLLVAVTCASCEIQNSAHVKDKPLSSEEHFDGVEHNAQYDHEAFLGQNEAGQFDQLPPDESRRRLGIIVDKIDTDGDGFVSEPELTSWITSIQKQYIDEDVDRQWTHYQHGSDSDAMTFEHYKKVTFGDRQEDDDSEHGKMYANMLKRDKRRWEGADENGDGKLTLKEFISFVHPEESEHMHDIIVQETMDDVDKDQDGFISVGEYLGDFSQKDENGDVEPEWLETERQHFYSFRDKNQNGKMDPDEVKDWILPTGYDHAGMESRHLIHSADTDNDEKLTKEEILLKWELFVGSQATGWGEALQRHDEF